MGSNGEIEEMVMVLIRHNIHRVMYDLGLNMIAVYMYTISEYCDEKWGYKKCKQFYRKILALGLA